MMTLLHVYNQHNKRSTKVHLFRAWWKYDILNPDMTGENQQTCHVIETQCTNQNYTATTGPHKIRDFSQDYVVVDHIPDGYELAGCCKRFLHEGGTVEYPEEQLLESGSECRGDWVRIR